MSIGYSIEYSEACTGSGPLTGAGTRPLLGYRRLLHAPAHGNPGPQLPPPPWLHLGFSGCGHQGVPNGLSFSCAYDRALGHQGLDGVADDDLP